MQIRTPFDLVDTPAFVYDKTEVDRVVDFAGRLRSETGCKVCYSIKSLSLPALMTHMAPGLDGFAVSSPFEARLASSCLAPGGAIHFTSPGIRAGEIEEIVSLCDYVSFNSLNQWQRFAPEVRGGASPGLRINPGLSFLDDERYDPCRPHSKLGVPLGDLEVWAHAGSGKGDDLQGILVHSNCESTDFRELVATVDLLRERVPAVLERLSWINLGGGYLFPEGTHPGDLVGAIKSLRRDYALEVILEPGAAFVRSAGCVVSTVLDVFDSGGKRVAVLDTTVNHMPELMEFDFEPDVLGHDDCGQYEYILAGCTCLAGDIFGEYRFGSTLEIGDRVVFSNMGSYTLTKAHMFNGVNLPTVYALKETGQLELLKRFDYQDYASRWNTYDASPV